MAEQSSHTCGYCGSAFSPTTAAPQLYCSRNCQHLAGQRRARDRHPAPQLVEAVCGRCCATFTKKTAAQRFCSPECRMAVAQQRFRFKDRSQQPKWVAGDRQICEHCQKEFTQASPSQKYCSRGCIKNSWYRRPGNAERAAATATKTRLAMRQEIFAHYGNGACECCGERHHEFLTIDHIHGGGSYERAKLQKQGHKFYVWLKQQGYPAGYRVLCMNCNHALGLQGYCPHQIKDKA